jgi:hypothetical protein
MQSGMSSLFITKCCGRRTLFAAFVIVMTNYTIVACDSMWKDWGCRCSHRQFSCVAVLRLLLITCYVRWCELHGCQSGGQIDSWNCLCCCVSFRFIQQIVMSGLVNMVVLFSAIGARGGIVVKALRYKPAGHGFDSRWCHWNFSVT